MCENNLAGWLKQVYVFHINLPLHLTSLGSGSHCPVFVHCAIVTPDLINEKSEEQLKVMFVPSNTKSLYPVTIMPESSENKGGPHLAIVHKIKLIR